jgi:Protein of unknown function (DUF3050)
MMTLCPDLFALVKSPGRPLVLTRTLEGHDPEHTRRSSGGKGLRGVKFVSRVADRVIEANLCRVGHQATWSNKEMIPVEGVGGNLVFFLASPQGEPPRRGGLAGAAEARDATPYSGDYHRGENGMTTRGARQARIHVVDLVEAVRRHPLYDHIRDAHSLRLLMRTHVFAVWDFQSLLKSLQCALTCVDVPWLPTVDAEARRFINELVLEEESDAAPGGGYLSHFELYLQAMTECGADREPIERFVRQLRAGHPVEDALALPVLPRGVAAFVQTTMALARRAPMHCRAAAFSFGREDVIPLMFRRLVERLVHVAPAQWSTFQYYLRRHIGRDEDTHAPLARQLVERLCGTDDRLWAEAEDAARVALTARIALWDDVLATILSRTCEVRGGITDEANRLLSPF